ncbi:MAG: hypothetical protein U1E76_09730 [Planctomycetota bacterium]
MGWGRYLLLGDLGQQLEVANQGLHLERLKHEMQSRRDQSRTQERRIDDLERENDELKLYVAALIRLLFVKRLATADEVRALVRTIDSEDGEHDHRLSGPVLPSA